VELSSNLLLALMNRIDRGDDQKQPIITEESFFLAFLAE
jgi:hypothetical protein